MKKIEAEQLGPIEVLVNNAGITRNSTMHRMSYEQWNAVIQTNLSSCFNMSRAVIEGMRVRGFGRIVNIGSINGQAGQYGQVNYAAAKSGIHGFTKALAQEGAARGITVNAVAPGYVDTEMVRAVPAEVLRKDHRPDSGRPARQGRRHRPHGRVPGRRRRRLHHRLDALGEWRTAHLLMRLAAVRRRGLSRRGFLALPIVLMSARLSAAQNEAENLEYREGRLHWSRGSAVAAVGRAGVKAYKHEGDGATPAGSTPLLSILYRPDRVAPPASQLPVKPLAPSDGWVDDPADANYNRPVSLPYTASAEQMWRTTSRLVVVIG